MINIRGLIVHVPRKRPIIIGKTFKVHIPCGVGSNVAHLNHEITNNNQNVSKNNDFGKTKVKKKKKENKIEKEKNKKEAEKSLGY